MTTRVLVVDDSPTIRRVVGAALQRAGHEVAAASTVDEVHERLATFVADLLLLDLTLPHLEDGLKLLERLHAERAWRPPVVAMAARSDDLAGVDTRLRRLGVVDVVTKPFSPEALIAVVRHSLDKWAALRRRSAADDFAADEHTVPARTRDPTTLAGPPTTFDASATGEPRRPRLTGGFALIGDLGHVALPEVLQLLQLQAQTGLLVVDTGERGVEVALEGGVVVGVVATDVDGGPASGGGLRLGSYLVATGGVDDAQLEWGLATTADGLVGERLVSAGIVDADLVRQAISEQVDDLVVEVLRARRGVFGLKTGAEHVPASALRPGWSVDALLFEALHRIDEWAVGADNDNPDDIAARDRPGARVRRPRVHPRRRAGRRRGGQRRAAPRRPALRPAADHRGPGAGAGVDPGAAGVSTGSPRRSSPSVTRAPGSRRASWKAS